MERDRAENAGLLQAFKRRCGLNYNLYWSNALVQELVSRDVKDWFIAPGRRNAPLIWALENTDDINMSSGIDERSLAFRALGNVKATGRPAALVCTSGSAVLHFMPALLEAYKSGLPLIAISADRPKELVAADANQCLEQNELIAPRLIPGAYWPGEKRGGHGLWREWTSLLPSYAKGEFAGPFHLNISFSEPLLTPRETKASPPGPMPTGYPKTKSPKAVTKIGKLSKKSLLILGDLSPYKHHPQWAEFQEKLEQYPGLIYSCLGSSSRRRPLTLGGGDHKQQRALLKNFEIDDVLFLGGRVLSKSLPHCLKVKSYHHVTQASFNQNPLIPATPKTIKANPIEWACLNLQAEPTAFTLAPSLYVDTTHTKSEMSWFHLYDSLVGPYSKLRPLIFLGNSSAIRAFDLSAFSLTVRPEDIFTQRGLSGIEGHLATAFGIAESSGRPLWAFMGDITAMHDLGSFSLLTTTGKSSVKIFIGQDYGGAIFKLLDSPNSKTLKSFMETPHNIDFAPLAAAFGISATRCTDEMLPQIEEILSSDSHEVLELLFNPQKNLDYFKAALGHEDNS